WVSGGQFRGPAALTVNSGLPLRVSPDGGHWAEGTSSAGVEAAMDPSLTTGTRKPFSELDFAALRDVGWQVRPTPAGGIASATQVANQTDAFFIGNDGALYVRWVVGLGVWSAPVRISNTGIAPPGAHLATAKQTANQLDVFFVDNEGALRV